ncbi:MAG TPA: DUF4239 domain-containing protein [Actinomycetota bacterium]|jgi:hypothetical protein|nr:DUF4239 domain-containing protein [Actinomycetota bacterium]
MTELFRSFLNNVPAGWMLLMVVGGLTGAAAAVAVVLDRLFPQLHGREDGGGSYGLRETYGAFYFFLLALVIANIQTTTGEADERVITEASAVARMVNGAGILPGEYRARLDGAVSDYLHAVVEKEFPSMREGKVSRETSAALGELYRVVQEFRPQTSVEEAFYSDALSHLGEITSARRHRLSIAEGSAVPELLKVFIIGGLVLFLALFYPASIPSLRRRATVFATFALIGSFALLLTIQLDYPFSGTVSVSSRPFQEFALAQYF